MSYHYKVKKLYGIELPYNVVVHHKDGNPDNWSIGNLIFTTKSEHNRFHSQDVKKVDGIWYKKCKICKKWYPITEDYWYFTKNGHIAFRRCKECHIKIIKFYNWKRKHIGNIDK